MVRLALFLFPICFVSTFFERTYALLSIFSAKTSAYGGSTSTKSGEKIALKYDLVIIGAGASGLFAAGAASSFGLKTLLLDLGNGNGNRVVGGDCTNAACVPSKALRSIARLRQSNNNLRHSGNLQIWKEAQNHTYNTVRAVREREDISNFDQVPNVDLVFVNSSRFISHNQMEISPLQASEITNKIQAKKYLIATGASPIVPPELMQAAQEAKIPVYNYRDILSPENEQQSLWSQLFIHDTIQQLQHNNKSPRIVLAGGGPTAVELAQSLARLDLNVTIVAPTLLPEEDVSLQQAACRVLRNDGVTLVLGCRVATITNHKEIILDNHRTNSGLFADAMIACFGRKPTVENLNLDAANVAWNKDQGVIVSPFSLRSQTNSRVFACGDCCSAVNGKSRKAAHGAWTGYHAIRNIALPRIFWGTSVHPTVPSVTYADPELASVGLTRSECIKKYGPNGFIRQIVFEEGMDRADMERIERFTNASFVELRAERMSGRILGMTACCPAASELANEIGLAVQNKLTVRDLARSIHSYPSHGYLLYRLGLSMALSSTVGFLDTLGPVGRASGWLYGGIGVCSWKLRPGNILPWRRKRSAIERHWESIGQQSTVIVFSVEDGDAMSAMPISFLDYFNHQKEYQLAGQDLPETFVKWVDSRPKLDQ